AAERESERASDWPAWAAGHAPSLGGGHSSHFLGRFSVFAYVRRGFRTTTEEL
ncbi:unnamed protein product, partial [Rangifer tarandus platyrhynchus]